MHGKVLVVDDDRMMLRLLEMNLEKVGCRVLKAEDGSAALDLAERESPQLIFLDLMMPDMDGWEVMRRLKQSDSTRDIPVVIITGKVDRATRNELMGMGAEDFISKPFELGDIRKLVAERLRMES
uniref:Response regulator n=1 Tax=Desulfobacca acetoxidans TaxID=60893 RepID=A0A7V4G846_9BACT